MYNMAVFFPLNMVGLLVIYLTHVQYSFSRLIYNSVVLQLYFCNLGYFALVVGKDGNVYHSWCLNLGDATMR